MSNPIRQESSGTSKEESKQILFEELKKSADRSALKGARKVDKAVAKFGPPGLVRLAKLKAMQGVNAISELGAKKKAEVTIPDVDLPPATEAAKISQGLLLNMDLQQAVIGEVQKTFEALDEFEFVRDLSSGGKLLEVAGDCANLKNRVSRWKKDTETAVQKCMKGATPQNTRALLEQNRFVMLQINNLSVDLLKSQTKAVRAIEFVATKAIVVAEDSDYTGTQDSVKMGIDLLDKSISVIDTAAEQVGTIPDAHAKAAAEATHICLSIIKVIKVPISRYAISLGVKHDMKNYLKEQGAHSVYEMHDKDPLLIAQRLKKKRVDDVKMILMMVGDPIVDQIKDLTPVPSTISAAWSIASGLIETTVEQYQTERIDLAREALGPSALKNLSHHSEDNTVERVSELIKFGENSLQALEEAVQGDVVAAFEKAAEGLPLGIIGSLSTKIAKLIVKALPIAPAQAISGAEIFSHMNGIINVAALFHEIAPVVQEPVCPQTTSDDVVVAMILSQPKEVGNEIRWMVRLAAPSTAADSGDEPLIGYVYSSDRRFEAISEGIDPLLLPPTTDYRGLPLSAVDITTSLASRGDGFRVTYWARVGPVVGRLSARELDIGPQWSFMVNMTNPSAGPRPAWKDRIILPPGLKDGIVGYRIKSTGTQVEGRWFRPLGANSSTYLMISDQGSWEWANGSDKAGNTPVSKVGDLLGESIQYTIETDVNNLLSRYIQ